MTLIKTITLTLLSTLPLCTFASSTEESTPETPTWGTLIRVLYPSLNKNASIPTFKDAQSIAFIGFLQNNYHFPKQHTSSSDNSLFTTVFANSDSHDFNNQLTEECLEAQLESIEYCVLASLFLGKMEQLVALLEFREDVLPYLLTRFYNDNAMLTHLAAASPQSSNELLQSLFSRGFCSKAKLTDSRQAWQVAEDVGNLEVAAFARFRAKNCKKTPPPTPTLIPARTHCEEL